jgi:hypothetical protein
VPVRLVDPGRVTARVTDANVYKAGSSRWVLRVTPAPAGCRVEMTWEREFRTGVRAQTFRTMFGVPGTRLSSRYARQVCEPLGRQ